MFDIKSRTSRAPYFWFLYFWRVIFAYVLVFSLEFAGLYVEEPRLTDMLTSGFASGLGLLIVVWPTLTIAIRRLHDSNNSGFWVTPYFFILFFFGANSIAVVIVLLGLELWWGFLKPTDGDNSYGPDPRMVRSQ